MKIICAAIASVLACGIHAQERSWIERYAEESALANRECGAKDLAGCRAHLNALLELLDGRADIVYRLAKIEASAGDPADALRWLAIYAKTGLSIADPRTDAAFSAVRDKPEFAGIVAQLDAARRPVANGRLVLTIPDKDLVTEDLAYDSATQRFFVSSVRHRKIVCISRDGKLTDFTREGSPGIWAMLAVHIDSKRRILWATTAAMPESLGIQEEERGRSALLKYSLESGEQIKRFDLPHDTEHTLGDMTVGENGDVFVSDSHGPVYWVDHRKDELEVLIPRGVFRSPQTPALTADGRTLFVPDYSRGVSRVDLGTKESRLIAHDRELSLAGIDGLYLAGRTMIAIQNGTSPARVIRMRLDSSLATVEQWETIEANWEGLGTPTHGVAVGDRFYFIANSGWDRLADNGTVKPGATFESPTIREIEPMQTEIRRTK